MCTSKTKREQHRDDYAQPGGHDGTGYHDLQRRVGSSPAFLLSNGIGRIGGWFGLVGMLLLTFTASLILSTAQDDINELAHKVGNTANHHVGVGAHLIVVLGLALFLYGAAAMVGALH